MSVLGPGTRVAIGWCPPPQRGRNAERAIGHTGTVMCGPYHPGERTPYGIVRTPDPVWAVLVDDTASLFVIIEPMLWPLGGGEPERVEEEREVETA